MLNNFRCIKCGESRLAEVIFGQATCEITSINDNLVPQYGSFIPNGKSQRFQCFNCGEPFRSSFGVYIKDYAGLVAELASLSPKPLPEVNFDDQNWPEAVPEYLIADANSDEIKLLRAEGIIDSIVKMELGGKKFLDFGCGEAHSLTYALTKGVQIAVGYDIEPFWERNHLLSGREAVTTDFSIVQKKGPFDIILAYDVLDHTTNESPIEMLKKMHSVLAENGVIYMRCHPWTSRHGTHLYTSYNKAYVHLAMDDKELEQLGCKNQKVLKLKNPQKSYRQWFLEVGFEICDETCEREQIDDYFRRQPKIWEKIARHWEGEEDISAEELGFQPYTFGSFLTQSMAQFCQTATSPVGQFKPNNFGIYDMHGNVWEWCQDWFAPYPSYDQINPKGPEHGTNKCLRGGSFADAVVWLRTAQRGETHPDVQAGTIGFRVVQEIGPDNTDNPLNMKFVKIEGDQFTMGSPFNEPGREGLGRDETPHRVLISKPYFIGMYPVKQSEYESLMNNNPSVYKFPDSPVECISWHEANRFCAILSEKTGKKYRLPTEAEWEYACRAVKYKESIANVLSCQFIDYTLTRAS